jgi:hypothetical protein
MNARMLIVKNYSSTGEVTESQRGQGRTKFLYAPVSPTGQAKRRGSAYRSPSMVCIPKPPFLFIAVLCSPFRVASEPVSVSLLGGDDRPMRRDLSAGACGEVRAGSKSKEFGPPTNVTT